MEKKISTQQTTVSSHLAPSLAKNGIKILSAETIQKALGIREEIAKRRNMHKIHNKENATSFQTTEILKFPLEKGFRLFENVSQSKNLPQISGITAVRPFDLINVAKKPSQRSTVQSGNQFSLHDTLVNGHTHLKASGNKSGQKTCTYVQTQRQESKTVYQNVEKGITELHTLEISEQCQQSQEILSASSLPEANRRFLRTNYEATQQLKQVQPPSSDVKSLYMETQSKLILLQIQSRIKEEQFEDQLTWLKAAFQKQLEAEVAQKQDLIQELTQWKEKYRKIVDRQSECIKCYTADFQPEPQGCTIFPSSMLSMVLHKMNLLLRSKGATLEDATAATLYEDIAVIHSYLVDCQTGLLKMEQDFKKFLNEKSLLNKGQRPKMQKPVTNHSESPSFVNVSTPNSHISVTTNETDYLSAKDLFSLNESTCVGDVTLSEISQVDASVKPKVY